MALNIALVCDWLTEKGGAEQVLLELHRMYPNAPIYTSQYRPKRIDWFKDATVKTGWLNFFPAGLRKVLGPLREHYFSHLDLSSFDLVISVTGAEAKGVRTYPHAYLSLKDKERSKGNYEIYLPPQPQTYHVCYCHVPTQYYWQKYDDYVKNPGFGWLNPVVRFFFRLLVKPLRSADYKAAQRPDLFITPSTYAAEMVQKYYDREAVVVAAPVDLAKFSTSRTDFSTNTGNLSTGRGNLSTNLSTGIADISTKPTNFSTKAGNLSTTFPQQNQSYPQDNRGRQPSFLIYGRQVTWKRFDLAIEACLKAGVSLAVIGDGPEHTRLVKLAAGSNLIHFYPWLSADGLRKHLELADGFLFPSLEPFGIAPLEALSSGCPVLAFAEGGSRDFIIPGVNGMFFAEQTVDSLAAAISAFVEQKFNRTRIAESVAAFSTANFRSDMTNLIDVFVHA